MNFQTAAIVAGAAFLLSLLAGLLGGVPFFDIVLRALFWALVGFGASLGIEALLRSLVPELFVSAEPAEEPSDQPRDRAVDITLDDDRSVRSSSFVEEVDTEAPVRPRAVESASAPGQTPEVLGPAAAEPAPAQGGEEEMPEIGSFLDAFKPNPSEGSEQEGEARPPEYGEYAPSDRSPSAAASEVTIDGEAQDPAILAKAVQTVMKRDAQGN